MPKPKGYNNVGIKKPTEWMKYSSNRQEWADINADTKEHIDEINELRKKQHKTLDDLYYEMQEYHLHEMQKNAHEIGYDDAFRIINDSIPQNEGRGWFVNADSMYKPRIFSYIMDNPQLLNAGWNVAYYHYKWQMEREHKTPLSFLKWLKTPQTYYRGSTGQKSIKEDRWVSYTHDAEIANRFATQAEGARVSFTRIRPIDTLGAYQDTGEAEIFVPRWKLKK